jgi:hypothetical protein
MPKKGSRFFKFGRALCCANVQDQYAKMKVKAKNLLCIV